MHVLNLRELPIQDGTKCGIMSMWLLVSFFDRCERVQRAGALKNCKR